MITSESAFIQESFVLSWYRYFSLARPMHARPKENRAKQWNLIIMHTHHWFGNAHDLARPFQEHCWPLSALPGDVSRSVSLWWPARPRSSEHLRAAAVCLPPYSPPLAFYMQGTVHSPPKTQTIVYKQCLHSSPQTLFFNSSVPAMIILSTLCWNTFL